MDVFSNQYCRTSYYSHYDHNFNNMDVWFNDYKNQNFHICNPINH